MTKKAIIAGILFVIVSAILYGICSFIYKAGQADIQQKWDKASIAHMLEIDRIREINDQKEEANRAEIQRISNDLQVANENHISALATARADFDKRLLKSEQRAAVYKRQAEGSTPECRALASHAAELDSALERGRDLVQRLRETLRFRDSQLISLGQQIEADRKLFSESDTLK